MPFSISIKLPLIDIFKNITERCPSWDDILIRFSTAYNLSNFLDYPRLNFFLFPVSFFLYTCIYASLKNKYYFFFLKSHSLLNPQTIPQISAPVPSCATILQGIDQVYVRCLYNCTADQKRQLSRKG